MPYPMAAARGRTTGIVVAGNWWEVAGQTCVAAYQPKGAADYAASKINLANQGTYDAVDGADYPTWATETGWTFGSNRYLVCTGLVPATNQTWSMIIRFNGAALNSSTDMAGAYDGTGKGFSLAPSTGIGAYYNNGGGTNRSPAIINTPAVMALAGNAMYRNGTAETGTIPAGSAGNTKELWIGGRNSDSKWTQGSIQAIAIYSTTLSASDVAALTTAMNAL